MVFSLKYKSVINLGKIKEAYSRSVNDKQARKMCIGEFRVLLTVTVSTMRMLPTMVKMKKNKNRTERTFCSFGFCVRPRKIK